MVEILRVFAKGIFDLISIEWDFGEFKFTVWQFWFVCIAIGVIWHQVAKLAAEGGKK